MALFGSSAATQAQQATEIDVAQDKSLANPPEDSISDVAFSPQADFLSVASWDNKVRIYEISNTCDSQGRALYEHQAPVLTTHWMPDGSKVISGGCDNAIRAFDVQAQQSAQIGQHESAVSSIRPVQAGGQSLIASCSWDKTLKYWDIRQQQPVATVQLPERAYTMDSQKNLLVVGTAQRNICVVDLNNPGNLFKTTASPLKYQTRVVTCYPDGSGYAVGSVEGRCGIQYIDEQQQKEKGFSFKCHREENTVQKQSFIYPVNDISFHPEFGTFTTSGSDGTFNIWDKEARFRLKRSTKAPGAITSTAFNRTGTILASAISYDWSKGHGFNRSDYPTMVKLHNVQEAEVKPRPKKK